jgi:glyoxalase family protein
MLPSISGFHHVTAIASDAARNRSFYTGVLGLRLVKQTVHLDDPSAFHLYYGDGAGRPGTILSFFIRPGQRPGVQGPGQATAVRLAIPARSVDAWAHHLARVGVPFVEELDSNGQASLALADPDGLRIGLLADSATLEHKGSAVGAPAVLGLHSIELSTRDQNPTRSLLSDVMGWTEVSRTAGRCRLAPRREGSGQVIDVVIDTRREPGIMGPGTVHHVALRAGDAEEQLRWRESLAANGLDVTGVRDRKYFQSIYFHEPGGVRFEIATDQPGFAVDEPVSQLGQRLQLPPALEPQRAALEARLGPHFAAGRS